MKSLPFFFILVLLIFLPVATAAPQVSIISSQSQSSTPSLDAWDIYIDQFTTLEGITFNKSDTVRVYLRITNLESTPAKIRYSIDYGSESYSGRASVAGSDSYELKKDFRPAQYGTNTIQVKLYNIENKLIDSQAITFHVEGNVYTDDISQMEDKVKTSQTEIRNLQTSIRAVSDRLDIIEADTDTVSPTVALGIGVLLACLAIAVWKGDFFRKKEVIGHAGSVPYNAGSHVVDSNIGTNHVDEGVYLDE